MATAASLAGIQQYGLGWKAQITLPVPDDIPAKIEDLETTPEVNNFVDTVVDTVSKKLVSYAKSNKLPPDSLPFLNSLLEELKEVFDYEDSNIDAADVEIKVEDLMAFLNDLYDWGDYYRVLISKSPHINMTRP